MIYTFSLTKNKYIFDLPVNSISREYSTGHRMNIYKPKVWELVPSGDWHLWATFFMPLELKYGCCCAREAFALGVMCMPTAEWLYTQVFSIAPFHLVSIIATCDGIPLWGTHGVGCRNWLILSEEYAATWWQTTLWKGGRPPCGKVLMAKGP